MKDFGERLVNIMAKGKLYPLFYRQGRFVTIEFDDTRKAGNLMVLLNEAGDEGYEQIHRRS